LDLCPQGIKVFIRKSELVTICTPPDWKVVAYSARTKKMFFSDLRHFRGEDRVIFQLTGNPQFNDIPINKIGPSMACELPVEKYKSTAEFAKTQTAAYQDRAVTGGFPCEITYSVSSHLALKPEIATLATRLYGFPKTDGVPIQLTYESIDTHKHTLFTTHGCHPKSFTSNDFKAPSGYLKVRSLAEVQADLKDPEGAESLIHSFDIKTPVKR
jgi:hypothetical protein